MRWYDRVVRGVLAVLFVAAGIAHLVLGRVDPAGYAVFADTAAAPWIADLWASWVMPDIGRLTILLAGYQIACGIGVLLRPFLIPATTGIAVFLIFITIIGYGLPADSVAEDLLTNRAVTALLLALTVPVLIRAVRAPLPGRAGARRGVIGSGRRDRQSGQGSSRPAMRSSRAMRSSIGGWVANR